MGSTATLSRNTVTKDSHCEMIHSLYIVKVSPYEDPNLAAADKLIHKLNQERILINESRTQKMMDRDKLYWDQRYRSRCSDWKLSQDKMNLSQLCLDKLQFANNSCRGRVLKPSSSVKEIDHHSLHFGLIHGSRKLSDEKRILRKVKEVDERVDECISFKDYNRKIAASTYRLWWPNNIIGIDKQLRMEEIKKLKLQMEEDIAGAAIHGKMWDSLGSKKNLIQQIQLVRDHMEREKPKIMEFNKEEIRVKKELIDVEKCLESLETQSINNGRLKYQVTEWISQWHKQYQEKNACCDSYIALMRHARELAENKKVVAAQSLCHQEVEKFMCRWNTDKDFRDDYETSIVSLNKRCLTGDGVADTVERNSSSPKLLQQRYPRASEEVLGKMERTLPNQPSTIPNS